MLAPSESHAQVKYALEIIYDLAHFDQIVWTRLIAGNRAEVFGIPLHMFHYFSRFGRVFVVLRNNVVPGQFAQAAEPEPGSKHRKPVQGLGLLLKSR